MEWADVLADPSLKNLPYKIELDHYGLIVMSPASNRHARIQGQVVRLLAQWFAEGEVLTECSIATPEGVKVADVASRMSPGSRRTSSIAMAMPRRFRTRRSCASRSFRPRTAPPRWRRQ